MKILVIFISVLFLTACSTNQKVVMSDLNDKLCENHKSDFNYFKVAFNKEHDQVCSAGCVYTPAMTKNSDTMERVAGLYYLMNCDTNHGRL